MQFFRNNIGTKSIACIWLGLLLLNIANKSLYLHIHKLENGDIVAHSHPFKKDKNELPNHEHSNFEYLVLNALDFFIASTLLVISFHFFLSIKKNNNIVKLLFDNQQYRYNKNKSPPLKII